MEVLITLIKLIWTYYLLSKFGIIFGVCFCFLSLIGYKYFMKYVFGLEMLGSFDKIFLGNTNGERFEILGVITFENNFEVKRIHNLILERAISKLEKLRKKIFYILGNYFWKEVSYEEAIKRIQIVDDENVKIFNEKDLYEYIKKEEELNIHINTLQGEIPYQIKIIPYADGKGGAVLLKFDHTLSDGLGMVSMILCLADNYDPNIFPPLLRNFKYHWYHQLFDFLSFFYYGPQVLFYIFFSKSGIKTPLKNKNDKVLTGNSNFSISKSFELGKFAQIRKDLGISFNDVIMSSISKTVKELCDHNKSKSKVFKCLIPVGRKGVPNSIKEIQLNNGLLMIMTELPIIEKVSRENENEVVKILRKLVRSSGYFSASHFLTQIAAEYLPLSIYHYFANDAMREAEILVSNVPGPTTPLYFGGCKASSIMPIPSTSRVRNFMLIYSYNKQFRIVMSTDINN